MTRKKLVAKFETWTPELARKHLEKGGPNRRLQPLRVQEYASAMRKGAWKINGETVKISTQGYVMDGQHRLHAVIESGVKVEILTVRNVTPAAASTVDDGYKRLTSHVLHIKGYKNTTQLAHLLGLVVRWEKGELNTMRSRTRLTRPRRDEQLAVLKRYPILVNLSNDPMGHEQSLVSRSVFAFMRFLIYQETETDQNLQTDEFFTKLAQGDMLSAHSPIYMLRERLISNKHEDKKNKLDVTGQLQLTVKAWNAWLTPNFGDIKQLRKPKYSDSTIPVIT